MIHFLIDQLKATPAVTAYTTADRIFPLIRLQGSTVPALVLQLVGCTVDDAKDTPGARDVHQVQVTGLATDPATCWALMEAARAALDNFQSEDLAEVRFLTHASDIFESSDLFTITATYAASVHR